PGTERLMSSLLSFILVLVAAAIARRSFGNTAMLGTLLSAAICPTWILLARYGSEQILLPVCLALAFLCIEVGREPGRRRWLWIGAVFLGLSAYSYHAAK